MLVQKISRSFPRQVTRILAFKSGDHPDDDPPKLLHLRTTTLPTKIKRSKLAVRARAPAANQKRPVAALRGRAAAQPRCCVAHAWLRLRGLMCPGVLSRPPLPCASPGRRRRGRLVPVTPLEFLSCATRTLFCLGGDGRSVPVTPLA